MHTTRYYSSPTQPRHVLVHTCAHTLRVCIDINIHYRAGHKFASRCQSVSARIARWDAPLKLRPPDRVLVITNKRHHTHPDPAATEKCDRVRVLRRECDHCNINLIVIYIYAHANSEYERSGEAERSSSYWPVEESEQSKNSPKL